MENPLLLCQFYQLIDVYQLHTEINETQFFVSCHIRNPPTPRGHFDVFGPPIFIWRYTTKNILFDIVTKQHMLYFLFEFLPSLFHIYIIFLEFYCTCWCHLTYLNQTCRNSFLYRFTPTVNRRQALRHLTCLSVIPPMIPTLIRSNISSDLDGVMGYLW